MSATNAGEHAAVLRDARLVSSQRDQSRMVHGPWARTLLETTTPSWRLPRRVGADPGSAADQLLRPYRLPPASVTWARCDVGMTPP